MRTKKRTAIGLRYVSEDTGYSRAGIYQWRKRYLKEGASSLMNNRNISSGELKEGTAPAESGCSSSHETAGLKKYKSWVSSLASPRNRLYPPLPNWRYNIVQKAGAFFHHSFKGAVCKIHYSSSISS